MTSTMHRAVSSSEVVAVLRTTACDAVDLAWAVFDEVESETDLREALVGLFMLYGMSTLTDLQDAGFIEVPDDE